MEFPKSFIRASEAYNTFEHHVPAPYLRRTFQIDHEAKANVIITALGFYELYLNGERITKGRLAPYISNPDDLVYYDTYEVMLRAGENVLGVWLGNGFTNNPGGHIWNFDIAAFRAAPQMALCLTYTDKSGEAHCIESDETWRTESSPLLFDDYRFGEIYDGRLEIPGWNIIGFDDSAWEFAERAPQPRGEKRLCTAEPIDIVNELKPISVTKTEKGYPYDTADIWQASADVSPWYGAWWGGNLRGVKDYPIDFGSKSRNSQIVYSPHDYGPSVYNQTWFDKDFTTQTLLDDYWYDTWAYINDQDIAPLLIGEWGGHMDGGKNQKWMELLRDYMIDNHINHTFWCLNPNSGDTGGLLDSSFTVWDDEKYDLFEPSLWQTSKTGKYISLDHQKPLGVNGTGISVSDYYKTYAESEGSNLDSDGSVNPLPTEDTTGSQSSDLKGDVNLNGTIEIADVVLLNKHLIKASVLKDQALENADVNDDKKLNVFDSIAIKRILL